MENEVGRLLDIVTGDLRDHERRIGTLEVDNATNKANITSMKESLGKIESNTTWLVRLIVGGMVGGAITLLYSFATK